MIVIALVGVSSVTVFMTLLLYIYQVVLQQVLLMLLMLLSLLSVINMAGLLCVQSCEFSLLNLTEMVTV